MFLNAGEFDKVKAAERAEHALNHSDVDRPKHYFYDHEMSKDAFEKQAKEISKSRSGKNILIKILEFVAFAIALGVVMMFFGGIFG